MIVHVHTVLKSYTGMHEWMEIICLQEQCKHCAFPVMSTTVGDISCTVTVEMY